MIRYFAINRCDYTPREFFESTFEGIKWDDYTFILDGCVHEVFRLNVENFDDLEIWGMDTIGYIE